MTESMIEKCARAIDPMAWSAAAFGTTADNLRRTMAERRGLSISRARAVLNTLKEPDEGMVEAMLITASDGPCQKAIFTAMISHILKESESK